MVLDELWRTVDGVESLSNADGGPLRRTVKLILDPLVIRPVAHPECAGPVVSAEGAALLAERIDAAADDLRATAAWFAVLKRTRRALRITEGNAQDLYFQRCYELAVTAGVPEPFQRGDLAEKTLRDIHGSAAGRTTQALREYLTEPGRASRLQDEINTRWTRRAVTPDHRNGEQVAIAAVLDGCVVARTTGASASAEDALDGLIEARTGTARGIQLWTAAFRHSTGALGLASRDVPVEPQVGRSAATATLALPFDRTVFERVFTALHSATDRAELPEIPDLVGAEIDRSCSPWALLDESLRVVATIGVELALGLHTERTRPDDTRSAAHDVVNGRWQREAYVLQARRLSLSDDPHATGPLAVIAAELRTPWRPYLRRLWVRLHGRDVRSARVYDIAELWDLLDGVARSVILDHRMRVKQALAADALAAGEPAEPRAS